MWHIKLTRYLSSCLTSYDNIGMIHCCDDVGMIQSVSVQTERSSCPSMPLSRSASLGSGHVQDASLHWLRCLWCWQSFWEVIFILVLHQTRLSPRSTTSQGDLKMRSGSVLIRETDITCQVSDENITAHVQDVSQRGTAVSGESQLVSDCGHLTLAHMSQNWAVWLDKSTCCLQSVDDNMFLFL